MRISILTKISIFDQNFDSCTKFRFLSKISILTKISIIGQDFDFCPNFDGRPKSRFSTKYLKISAIFKNMVLITRTYHFLLNVTYKRFLGLCQLWRGFPSLVLRIFPYAGIQFLCFDVYKDNWNLQKVQFF